MRSARRSRPKLDAICWEPSSTRSPAEQRDISDPARGGRGLGRRGGRRGRRGRRLVRGVLLVEALDTAGCVDDLLLARVERMAVGADIHHAVTPRGIRLGAVAARAGDHGLLVDGMYAFLSHGFLEGGC